MSALEVASRNDWVATMHNSRVNVTQWRQTAILQVRRLMQQECEASRWIMFMLESRLESVERVAKAIIPMNSRWLKWYIINEGNMKFITWGAFAEWETPHDAGRDPACVLAGRRRPKTLRNAVRVQVNLVAAGVPVRCFGWANLPTAAAFKMCYINKIWLCIRDFFF